MPDRIILATPRYKGEFLIDFDDPPPSALEWRWIKKIADYYPSTVGLAIDRADPDFYIALACIALVRAGRIAKDDVYQTADELAELPVDGVTLRYEIGRQEAAAEDPPVAPPPTGPPAASTGAYSSSTSAPPAPSLSPTGAPD